MDMSPFKLDIFELVDAFEQKEGRIFAQFKSIWRERKFSFIHEARPTAKDSAFFMQTLYDHAISHMVSEGSLSRRLAGLYALYCLYETQLFDPPFKIYLSLKDLERLNALIVDSKHNHVKDSLAVVRRMLDKGMFLFGFVEVDEELVSKTLNNITEKQHAHLRIAAEKLLSDTKIRGHIQMNLAKELKLDELSDLAKEYSNMKEAVWNELTYMKSKGKIVNMPELNKSEVGEDLYKIAGAWNQQCHTFSDQTGLIEKEHTTEEEEEDLVQELDLLLSEDS